MNSTRINGVFNLNRHLGPKMDWVGGRRTQTSPSPAVMSNNDMKSYSICANLRCFDPLYVSRWGYGSAPDRKHLAYDDILNWKKTQNFWRKPVQNLAPHTWIMKFLFHNKQFLYAATDKRRGISLWLPLQTINRGLII